MRYRVALSAMASNLKPAFERTGAKIAVESIVSDLSNNCFSEYVRHRDLIGVVQHAERCPTVATDSPLYVISAELRDEFSNFPKAEDIENKLRASCSRKIDDLISKLPKFPEELQSSLAALPAEQQSLVRDAISNKSVIAGAMDGLRREHIYLALKPTMVGILSGWLEGEVARHIEEGFHATRELSDGRIRSLWKDGAKADYRRYEVAYVARRSLLHFCDSVVPEKRSLATKSAAMLHLFEWDVAALWNLWKAERHAVDYDMIDAVCREVRAEIERENGR